MIQLKHTALCTFGRVRFLVIKRFAAIASPFSRTLCAPHGAGALVNYGSCTAVRRIHTFSHEPRQYRWQNWRGIHTVDDCSFLKHSIKPTSVRNGCKLMIINDSK